MDGPFGTQLKVEEYQESGIPLIRVSNCRTGNLLESDELVYISEQKHRELMRSEVLPGDVLLTKAGHILGYAAVFPDAWAKGNITSHLASIRPSENVASEFLATYLSSPLGIKQIYRWGNKSTRPELNTDEVRQILLPLPPLDVQRTLVAQIEAARAARQAKLAQADALLAGIDDYVLKQLGLELPAEVQRSTYAVTRGQLGSRVDASFYAPYLLKVENVVRAYRSKVAPLSSLLKSPPINGVDARDFQETGYRYLRVQNVRPFELALDDVKCVSDVGIQKDISLSMGDVLLTRKGTFGVAAPVTEGVEDCLISSEIILLRLSTTAACSAAYLVAWLNSKPARILLDRQSSGGIMGHLTQEVVSTFPVPIPDEATQNEIIGEITYRREIARRLRAEAAAEREAAKARFEQALLAGVEV